MPKNESDWGILALIVLVVVGLSKSKTTPQTPVPPNTQPGSTNLPPSQAVGYNSWADAIAYPPVAGFSYIRVAGVLFHVQSNGSSFQVQLQNNYGTVAWFDSSTIEFWLAQKPYDPSKPRDQNNTGVTWQPY